MTLACEGSATQALEATRCGSFDFARRLASLRMTLHSERRRRSPREGELCSARNRLWLNPRPGASEATRKAAPIADPEPAQPSPKRCVSSDYSDRAAQSSFAGETPAEGACPLRHLSSGPKRPTLRKPVRARPAEAVCE